MWALNKTYAHSLFFTDGTKSPATDQCKVHARHENYGVKEGLQLEGECVKNTEHLNRIIYVLTL